MKGLEDQHTKMQRQFGYPSIVSRIQSCQTQGTYALTGLEMHLDIKKNESQQYGRQTAKGRGGRPETRWKISLGKTTYNFTHLEFEVRIKP